MPESNNISEAEGKFAGHYDKKLRPVTTEIVENEKNIKRQFFIHSDLLRKGNSPRIFSHGEKTKDVIVLTHGLTDSPYYMQAIGERFYQAGFNVVLPLLPGHGLKDPDKAMEDRSLDEDWRMELDQAAEVALLLGDRVSLGGFSTGGALSLNKLLRDSKKITGGIFLFSAAIDLGSLTEGISANPFFRWISQSMLKVKDGIITGTGPNPYKYPELPEFAGIELGQIINENEDLLKKLEDEDKKIANPVFAAHSVHDTRVKIAGFLELFENHIERGLAWIISQKVRHEEVVLAEDIELTNGRGLEELKKLKPKANPKFDLMMKTAIQFFSDSLT